MTPDEFKRLIEAEPPPRGYSNCIFWAAHMLRRHGGYGLLRRGHNGVPLHCLWSPDHANVASFEPLSLGRHWRFSDSWHGDLLLLFRGQIVIGDDPLLGRRRGL